MGHPGKTFSLRQSCDGPSSSPFPASRSWACRVRPMAAGADGRNYSSQSKAASSPVSSRRHCTCGEGRRTGTSGPYCEGALWRR